jgi:succinate dehydrogenase hydrophobic anchor subunit
MPAKQAQSSRRKAKKQSFLGRHSLSIVAAAVLVLWLVLYCFSDPRKHLGAFFGNAIADWLGLLVMVLATKYMYEVGSAESRKPPRHWFLRGMARLQKHSLTIFLIVTGIGWAVLFGYMDANAKWGEVVGNIVSEWTQVLGLVLLTKVLTEIHSKESRHDE